MITSRYNWGLYQTNTTLTGLMKWSAMQSYLPVHSLRAKTMRLNMQTFITHSAGLEGTPRRSRCRYTPFYNRNNASKGTSSRFERSCLYLMTLCTAICSLHTFQGLMLSRQVLALQQSHHPEPLTQRQTWYYPTHSVQAQQMPSVMRGHVQMPSLQ